MCSANTERCSTAGKAEYCTHADKRTEETVRVWHVPGMQASHMEGTKVDLGYRFTSVESCRAAFVFWDVLSAVHRPP